MFIKSLNLQFCIFSLHLLKFINYLPILLFLLFLFSCLTDFSIAFCMEQDCKYVVNNEGNIQLHPKTGEPLQNCKITKSDYVVALETIERVVDKASLATEKITSEIASNNEECKS